MVSFTIKSKIKAARPLQAVTARGGGREGSRGEVFRKESGELWGRGTEVEKKMGREAGKEK